MIELKVHRFQDCDRYPSNAGLNLRHKLSSLDLTRVTCEDCKRRILEKLAKLNWSKLAVVEVEALELNAAEVEAGG